MAGFFDGEGCVAINRQKRKASHNPSYVVTMSICQKEIDPLIAFQMTFGGHLYPYQVKGIEYWRWHTWGDIALRCLEAIVPFLIVKEKRAKLAIQYQKNLTKWNKEYGRRGYPPEILAAREQAFLEMRTLNKRGVATNNPIPAIPGVKAGSPNYFRRTRIKPDTKEKESVRVN